MTVVFDYLVFNVQFIFAVSQQLIHYIIHFVVCQVFFLSFFEKLFLLDRKPLLKIFIQQLLYYIISLNFCQELFFNFFWFFIFSSCSVLTVSNFYILSQSLAFVKHFFNFFQFIVFNNFELFLLLLQFSLLFLNCFCCVCLIFGDVDYNTTL